VTDVGMVGQLANSNANRNSIEPVLSGGPFGPQPNGRKWPKWARGNERSQYGWPIQRQSEIRKWRQSNDL